MHIAMSKAMFKHTVYPRIYQQTMIILWFGLTIQYTLRDNQLSSSSLNCAQL